MKEYRTKAVINAPAHVVWKTLTNLKAHEQFDPSCIKIDGNLSNRSHLTLHSRLNGGEKLILQIIQLKPNSMVWEQRLPFNLFTRKRTFLVIGKDDQTSEFHMEELVNGYLYVLFSKKLANINDYLNKFSKGLKYYIESRP